MKIDNIKPEDIEKRSFEMINEEIKKHNFSADFLPIITRVIHASADFDYIDNLKYSPHALKTAERLLTSGSLTIVTDTEMAKAGINKRLAAKHGIGVECFISDSEVIEKAKKDGRTRASVAIDKLLDIKGNLIFVSGNAPTSLIEICSNYKKGLRSPDLVVAVPVGFVNVIEAKELVVKSGLEYIAALGRKGGSNVAAAIVNALLYKTFDRGEK